MKDYKIYYQIKRGFDIFNSFLALTVLFPLFLFICIGIKVSSKGPVFYVSERIGKNRVPFKMLKFRSMHIKETDKKESRYLVNETRIFKFGRFIRKCKLDELPQLVNILIGDMSIVGPRPYPKSFTDKSYTDEYADILSVKPGLACLDSLFDYAHGELFTTDEEDYAKNILPYRTELAKMYVEDKSIWLDIYCILRTIKLIIEIGVLRKKDFSYTKYERKAFTRLSKSKPE